MGCVSACVGLRACMSACVREWHYVIGSQVP